MPVPVPAVPASGPLLLVGNDQERLAECAGRDVTVTGTRSAYDLRGGCRSLSIRGDLVTVRAELQPGAHISVNGQGSLVTWRLVGRGHPPVAAVQGAGSRGTARAAGRLRLSPVAGPRRHVRKRRQAVDIP